MNTKAKSLPILPQLKYVSTLSFLSAGLRCVFFPNRKILFSSYKCC